MDDPIQSCQSGRFDWNTGTMDYGAREYEYCTFGDDSVLGGLGPPLMTIGPGRDSVSQEARLRTRAKRMKPNPSHQQQQRRSVMECSSRQRVSSCPLVVVDRALLEGTRTSTPA